MVKFGHCGVWSVYCLHWDGLIKRYYIPWGDMGAVVKLNLRMGSSWTRREGGVNYNIRVCGVKCRLQSVAREQWVV